MTDAIKKCSDCMFSTPSKVGGVDKWDSAKCRHAAALKEDEAKWHLGEAGIDYYRCSSMRIGICGKAAKLFEPRVGDVRTA